MSKKRTSKQLLVELKNLTQDRNQNIFKSLTIAAELFHNTDWIIELYDGDTKTARKAIEKEHFSWLGGLVSLDKLVQVIERFPTEAVWQEYNNEQEKNRMPRTMKGAPTLPCQSCGKDVKLPVKRRLELVRSEQKPICKDCRPYVRFETSSGGETTDSPRYSQDEKPTGVASLVFVPDTGKKGHQYGPLARGRVK